MIAAISIALVISLILLSAVLFSNAQLRSKVRIEADRYEKSKNRVLQLFENSPDAILIMDRDGTVTSANLNASKLLNMDREQITTGRIQDLLPAGFRGEMNGQLIKWFAGGTETFESTFSTSDQRMVRVELLPCLQTLNGRNFLEVHVRDITLRARAEREIHAARQMAEDSLEMANQARKEAENSSRNKSEFLAAMSRDLRIPLHNIVGAGQLLSDEQSVAEQQEYLQMIQGASQSLLKVINHVLDIAKIEAGQMETVVETFDIRELCSALEACFKEEAEQKGLYLECSCRDNVPQYLTGDPVMLEHVLENLLGNALKFTESGSVCLKVECHSVGSSGASIYYEVVDSGIGISSDKQKRLFEKFVYSGQFSKTESEEATGLGLAICKRQVELMGGILGAKSELGQGSSFYFSLLMPVAGRNEKSERRGKISSHKLQGEGMRILLAEDNRLNRKVAEDLLIKSGCQVETVANGRDAMLQVRKARYDVILMDCEMPVMDGFESTRKIRTMPAPYCDMPIIALTANAMRDDIKKCTDAGMTAYLSKPISRKRLIEVLNLHVLQV